MSEKIQIQFNDKPLEVEKGARLIEVCAAQGIEVPRFCYHPGLSVVGSCRMCQVEVAGPGPAPRRLAISCRTDCVPGLQVWTDTSTVHTTRKSVLEFLLKNHPLDCPICDKAGECPLQNYTYAEGQGASRSEDPKRNFRKRVDLGPVILLDEERCVLCTRCVRFCDEVDKDAQLLVRSRGPNAMIGTFEDEALHGNYQGNLADICPVGALTLKKFRFKARVWNLKKADSICPGCSRGCNITVEAHRGKVVRIRPRYNAEVNKHWICDIGRFGFDPLNENNRLRQILYWKNEDYIDEGWETGIAQSAQLLTEYARNRLYMIASPYLSNEEGKVFAQLCTVLGVSPYVLIPNPKTPDHVLYTGELGPNQRGLKDLGFKPMLAAEIPLHLKEKSGFYFAGENIWNLLDATIQESLAQAQALILQDTKVADCPGVDIFLPAWNWAEKRGTFTNGDGKTQKFASVLKAPAGTRSDSELFESLRKQIQKKEPVASTPTKGKR